MSESWHQVSKETEFPADGKLSAKAGEWQALIVREGDEYFAYNDCCTHQAAALSGGRVRRGTIMCPLHGARFEVKSGRCVGGAYPALKSFAVRISDGMIEVGVPETPPGQGEKPTLTS